MEITVFRPATKQQVGPFGLETVRAMLARGELSNDDLIYYQGVTEWTPILKLPATEPSLAAPPAVHVAAPPAPSAVPLTLDARVAELERRLARSNLHSASFWSRAFAVLGHNFSAVLAIYAVLFVIGLIIMLIAAMVGAFTR
jgi:hypothetical protein